MNRALSVPVIALCIISLGSMATCLICNNAYNRAKSDSLVEMRQMIREIYKEQQKKVNDSYDVPAPDPKKGDDKPRGEYRELQKPLPTPEPEPLLALGSEPVTEVKPNIFPPVSPYFQTATPTPNLAPRLLPSGEPDKSIPLPKGYVWAKQLGGGWTIAVVSNPDYVLQNRKSCSPTRKELLLPSSP